MSKLLVRCENGNCQELIPLENIAKHQESCEYALICNQCEMYVSGKEKNVHFLEHEVLRLKQSEREKDEEIAKLQNELDTTELQVEELLLQIDKLNSSSVKVSLSSISYIV